MLELAPINQDTWILFEEKSLSSNPNNYIVQIIDHIKSQKISKGEIRSIILLNGIQNIKDIHLELTSLVLNYIEALLISDSINEFSVKNIIWIKMLFEIKDGVLYKFHRERINQILHNEFMKLLEDNYIDKKEALYKVDLQKIFGLNYDQLNECKQAAVKIAIENGANLLDLDTIYF